MTTDQDAKKRIIIAALEILDEVNHIEKITVRQIAKRANVGVGLINYHFQSRDNLLSVAIGDVMAKMATEFVTSDVYSDSVPVLKLKRMLKELFNFGLSHEKLIRFTLTQGLLNGDMKAGLFLVPVLKEMFEGKKDELQLRIIAAQIILPIQVASLNPTQFKLYSGIDLNNESERNNFLETMVDNLFCM
jgi:AcrR family transcriptional regulator